MDFLTAHRDKMTEGAMDFAPNPAETLNNQINRVIDKALEEDNAKQTPRDYLGGSRLGVSCLRALYYEYTNTPKDEGKDFPGHIIRRFRMGHWHEDETAEWLALAGFDLRTHKANGEQYGFAIANGKIAGHIDGVLLDGPRKVQLPYPALWEHKIMNNKQWTKCKKEGVQKAKPVYYAQCQTYMAYMELQNAVFQAVNTDTSELYTEVVPFNQTDAQRFSDRGVKVISAHEAIEMPRLTRDPNHFECNWCSYAQRCWAEPA